MASATVSQYKQLFPATATSSRLSSGKVSFTLKLENDWGKDTLQDLTKLVNIFGVSGSHLHLSKVEDGCIAVTWLCSTSEVKQLKMAIIIRSHWFTPDHGSAAGIHWRGGACVGMLCHR